MNYNRPMRTMLAVGGPIDGKLMRLPDEAGGAFDPSWAGVYRRHRMSPAVEVLAYTIPVAPTDRWAPRRRTANFGVDRKPFGR